MHKAGTFFFVCAGFLCLAVTGLDAEPVLGADHTVGAIAVGDCGVVVMAGGDLFVEGFEEPYSHVCDRPQQLPWVLLGNLFSLAGRGAPGPVVGMNQNFRVLTASGDWFQLSIFDYCAHLPVTFLCNVFEVAGVRAPGEEFVTVGVGPYESAVTTYGNVYRACTSTYSEWKFIGVIPSGPTNASRPSWGTLKSIYR